GRLPMNRYFITLLCIPAAIVFATVAQADDPVDDFVVVCWNLEWFFDNEVWDNRSELAKKMSAPDRARWDWRRDAVAASIASVSPSIVAVQEAESRKVMGYLAGAINQQHGRKFRVACIDGAEPFTE